MPFPRTLPAALALAAALLAAAPPAGAEDATLGDLTVSEVWARPNLPNRPTAAYARIGNAGAEADRLIGAASPAFGRIELHLSEMSDGVMSMRRVEAIEAPAGGSVALEPGGYHLMLFEAERVFAPEESFPLTLEFERAGTVELTVPVRPRSGGGHGHGHGAMHGSGEGG